jgi:hypothetical protein
MTTIIDVEQGSDAWFRARMGRPTASQFSTVMAKGKGGGESVTRRKYLYQLAAEIVSGEPSETYSNGHMERGKLMEPEARAAYAFLKDAEPRQVGFVHNDLAGASPDALLGDKGVLEIKTKLPALLVECIMSGEFPAEHKAQCQGALWVCEREFVDIAVFWPKLPLFVVRQQRDEAYIASIMRAVREFNDELAVVVDKLRRYEEAA